MRILLVANLNELHIGSFIADGIRELGLEGVLRDLGGAYDGPFMLRKINWLLRGHRPTRLEEFSRIVEDDCRRNSPHCLITTGISPISSESLQVINKLGVPCLNFLTDDPWNPNHLAPWFLKALPKYDMIFSPRRANLTDLRNVSCREVHYLPFAYSPQSHFPEPASTPEESKQFESDVLFIGGADSDRLPIIRAIIAMDVRLALYGGYWERCRETRPFARGFADRKTMRKAISSAKLCVGLVRRMNRDGHVMRSFEIPAMGGCLIPEDTEEHRELFGPEGQCVLYFKTPKDLSDKIRTLLDDEERRLRLKTALHARITGGRNTYRDRVQSMVSLAGIGDLTRRRGVGSR